jgi:hypothetical protein
MPKPENNHLGTISILIKDRHAQAPDINQILTKHGNKILGRMGLNLQPRCLEHCTAMITVVVYAPKSEIDELTLEIDQIYGIVARSNIVE